MNKILAKFIVFSTLAVLLLGQAPLAQASAVFNNHSLDRPTLRTLNLSETDPTCRSCWVSSVTADPGDIISFDVYYHNNSSETARNVKIRVNFPEDRFINRTITAEISADNAATAFGSVGINLSESRVLSIVPGSVRWFPDQAAFGNTNFLYNQNGDEIVNSVGLRLGDISPGFSHQGHVAFKARVSTGSGGSDSDIPFIFTDNPTSVSQTSALFRGQVNPHGRNTTAWFNYGTTFSLGTITGTQSVGSGNSSLSFSQSVFSLSPNTTYYVRAEAENSFGTSRGDTISFRTSSGGQILPSGNMPATATLSPTFVSRNSAILNGSVHPNNSSASGWFEWGRTEALGNRTENASLGSGSSFIDFTSSLSGLSPNTLYYYRAAGQNSFGTTFGNILTFRTLGTTVIPVIPPGQVLGGAVSISSVTLSSELDKDEVAAGENIELTLKYKNNGSSAITNANLKVVLPSEVEYRESSEEPELSKEDNVFNFPIGRIAAGASGEITIKARVNRGAEKDSVLIFASTLNFTNGGGQEKFVDSYATAKVIEGGSLLGASILDLLRGIFGSIWFYFLLILILIAYIAWYYGKKSVAKSELPG